VGVNTYRNLHAGGFLKKTVLATGAMTAAAAVCYPREATDISQYSWSVASEFASTTYHDLFDCEFTLLVDGFDPFVFIIMIAVIFIGVWKHFCEKVHFRHSQLCR